MNDTILNSAAYEDMADVAILTYKDLVDVIKSFILYSMDAIVYCKTDFTPWLFEHLKLCSRNHVLITHHSDYPINDDRVSSMSNCIIKWFGINKATMDNRVVGIPIGTKTPAGRVYHDNKYDIGWLEGNLSNLISEHKSIDTVYCNWNITSRDRANVLSSLKVPYFHSSGLAFKDYCKEMSKFKIVISPPGNGLDNHRTWEALYMGCIPVVIDNPMYDSWPSLPIVRVKSYSDLNMDIIRNSIATSFISDMIALTPSYWRSKIQERIK